MSERKLGPWLSLALLLGLAGIAFGLAVVFANFGKNPALATLSWLPYVLGGSSMILSVIAGIGGRPSGPVLAVFLLGGAAVAMVPLFWLALVSLVVIVVGELVLDGFLDL